MAADLNFAVCVSFREDKPKTSLRTADVFPVVPPENSGGTTGNTSAVRRLAENKTAKVFTLNTALKGASLLCIFFNKETISATIVNFLVEFTLS